MVIRKNMTNAEIYNHANNLLNAFEDIADLSLPVKVHFYFQKNINVLIEMAQELEKSRNEIMSKYGTLDEESKTYKFEENKLTQANKDIEDLFSVEQEVAINVIPLEWFDSVNFTAKQVNAFSFMLEEEE